MIKTSLVHRNVGGASIALSLLAGAANAQTKSCCSVASVNGTYGLRFYGHVTLVGN